MVNAFTCPSSSDASALPLPATAELFVPVVVKANDPVGLGGFRTSSASRRMSAPNLMRVPAAHQRKRVQELGDGGREFGVGGGSRADLLESGDGEDRQHRAEGIRRQARYGDSAILKRRLIQVAPGIADAELVQSRWRERPVVVADEGVAARDRVADHSGGQAAASVRQAA